MSKTINVANKVNILFLRTCYLPKCVGLLQRPLTYSYLTNRRPTSSLPIKSSLFVSDEIGAESSNFEFDHGFEKRIKDIESIKTNLRRRGCSVNVDSLLKDYKTLCELHEKKTSIEETRKHVAEQMKEFVKGKTEADQIMKKELQKKGKDAKLEFKKVMANYWDVEQRFMLNVLSLPNDTTPDEADVQQILEEKFHDSLLKIEKNHLELIEECKDVALSPIGDRAYYLRGRLALLEQELVHKFTTDLQTRGITPVLGPEIVKTPIAEGGGIDVTAADDIYRLYHKPVHKDITDWDSDNSYVRGVSQLSFLAYFARMVISRDSLPLSIYTVGRSYVPVNDGNKDLPGLLGVLQTIQISMCGVCDSATTAVQMMEQFKASLTNMYDNFNIAYRLVCMPYSSLASAEMNRVELQMWVPSLNDYLKVASVSMTGDYSSRRLMIHCAEGDHHHSQSSFVHMVHCDVADITRLIAILLEHGQTDKHWVG